MTAASLTGIQLPHYSDNYTHTHTQELPPTDETYEWLRAEVESSVVGHRRAQSYPHSAPPKLCVTRIEQILNKRIQTTYFGGLEVRPPLI